MIELFSISKFPKDPAVGFKLNDPCYWDERNRRITEAGCGAAYVGRASSPAAVGDQFVSVKIHISDCTSGPSIVTLPPGWNATKVKTPAVQMLELKEFCYAATLIEEVDHGTSVHQSLLARWRKNLRDLLLCHRFDVLAWLMQQGVQIPAELIADCAHPTPGNQSPDRAAPVAPPAS